jgi:pimeloyl-ACP methyl ester carboxylesterase
MSTLARDPDAGWAFSGWPGRATRVTVTGGRGPMSVDTAELATLRQRLLAAADLVTAADEHTVVNPLEYMPGVPWAWTAFEEIRDIRIQGAGLQRLVRRIHDLAADLELQRLWYEEAEMRASTVFRPPAWRYVVGYAPKKILPARVRQALNATRAADVLRVGGHVAATYHGLNSSPLPDAIVAQRHAAALGESMQYMSKDMLDGSVKVDGEQVDVRERTSVQRSALVALPWLTRASMVRNGGRPLTDVTTSMLRGPTTALDPTALHVPGGLGHHGPVSPEVPGGSAAVVPGVARAIATTVGSRVPTPRTETEALGRIPELEDEIGRRGTGAVEILRTTTAEGHRHWTVVIPGTQDPWAGGENPMDNETNLLAIAGVRSDMAIGVAAAMHQAGIARGEPVAMVGHSQGGLVATELAADPVLKSEFRISTVLTAGSPVGTMKIPPGVEVLSLEHVQDPVVGLDGAPNTAAPNHITVAVGGAEAPASLGDAHRLPGYLEAADLLPGLEDPSVQQWVERNREAMGSHVDGARTDSMVFEIRRR